MKIISRFCVKLLLFTLVITLFYSGAAAQNFILKGQVTDQESGKPVGFASVGVRERIQGALTDIHGNYHLELPQGTYTVMFSSVEYERVTKTVTLSGEKVHLLNVSMKLASHELNTIIISDSKYEQRVEESIASIVVLRPRLIETKNITSLDQAIEQIPGVSIIDNEPQIRAGSGFSSGLGSRVMVLIDEIPILRADAGRPVWSFLPIEDIEQIEILKGASSVVYGSSALNGAINIRTAYPKEKPETRVIVHGGIYNNPARKYAKSWDGFNPVIVGSSFIHSRQIKNVDFVAGGNVLSDPGYIRPAPSDSVNRLNKGEYEQRIRLNFGTRVRSKKVENLTYGLNGNFMYSKNAQAYFWEDADSNIYRSYPGALTNFREYMFYVDPYVKYFGSRGASHALKNRWFFTDNGADNDQSTRCNLVYNEYQFSKRFKELGNFIINTGILNMYVHSTGKVFSGHLGEEGTHESNNLAVYLQLEKKFFSRITLLVGGRMEYFKIDEFEESKPVFRAGINTRLTKITYLRASVGQGYRFPSIGERYIVTNVGNFGFYPNPELMSESSWNTEVGIKQLFKVSSFVGFVDICGFWQEYDNYVEFNAALWGTDPNMLNNMGFKFLNTGPTRVRGIDCSITGEGNLAKNLHFGLLAGYTYSLPQSLDPHFEYYKDSTLSNTFSYSQTSSDTTNYVLKYRIQHLAKLDMQFTWKNLSVGMSGKYYSFMKNIDNFFIDFDRPAWLNTGISEYRKSYNDPNLIWDARISFEFKKHFTFSFIVNNVLNKEYSLRPITIEPPRTTMLQIIYKA